jgi:hypothetical protein
LPSVTFRDHVSELARGGKINETILVIQPIPFDNFLPPDASGRETSTRTRIQKVNSPIKKQTAISSIPHAACQRHIDTFGHLAVQYDVEEAGSHAQEQATFSGISLDKGRP